MDFSALNAFEYCGEVKVAKMYHNSEADINHKMEPNKRYRILADAQDYLGKVEIQLRFTETTANGMNNAGCVVLAVGEMENDNLVKK